MWQTLLLYRWKKVFGWLPIETVIKENQEEYYKVLGDCDRLSDSGPFVEFILKAIYETIIELSNTEQVSVQVEKLLGILGNKVMSTKDMMNELSLKHRPTFRYNYLLPAIKLGVIEMTIPEKPNSSKQKYRMIPPLP
ncbi:MAG: hypothetical protein OCD02_19770 [Spirochaetaceae bacterium]